MPLRAMPHLAISAEQHRHTAPQGHGQTLVQQRGRRRLVEGRQRGHGGGQQGRGQQRPVGSGGGVGRRGGRRGGERHRGGRRSGRKEQGAASKPQLGADEDQALLQAVDAMETVLSLYIDARKPLPPASKAKPGQRTVRPSALKRPGRTARVIDPPMAAASKGS